MRDLIKKLFLLQLIAIFLVACGGGGGGGIGDDNTQESNSNTSTSRVATAYTLEQVDIAQTFSQPIKSSRQYLVPNKQAVLRAHVYAPENTNSRTINLYIDDVYKDTLTCPNLIPTTIPGSTIIEYDTNKTCYTTISAGDIVSGFKIKLIAGDITKEYSPNVSSVRDINITVFRVKLLNNTSNFTDSMKDELESEIKRSLPFTTVSITINNSVWDLDTQSFTDENGSSLTLTDNLGNSSDQWTSVVKKLEALRSSNNSSSIYYGLIPANNFSSGIAGIAYCNNCGSVTEKNYSAIGLNLTSYWKSTLLHELAHNLSAMHTECGATEQVDSNYPYDDGKMGSTPILKTLNDDEYEDPRDYTQPYDIMGYCSGERFSDYNYRRIQSYLESNTITASSLITLLAINKIEAPTKLYISGIINPITNTGMIEPITEVPSIYQSNSTGKYLIKLYTSNGQIINHRFNASKLADILTHNEVFNFKINSPADGAKIIKLEIFKDDQLISINKPQSPAQMLRFAYSQSLGQELANQSVNINDSGDQVTVEWNNSIYPWLKLVHIDNFGKRNTIAIDAKGGDATFPIKIDQGGQWEVTLSEGLHTITQTVDR